MDLKKPIIPKQKSIKHFFQPMSASSSGNSMSKHEVDTKFVENFDKRSFCRHCGFPAKHGGALYSHEFDCIQNPNGRKSNKFQNQSKLNKAEKTGEIQHFVQKKILSTKLSTEQEIVNETVQKIVQNIVQNCPSTAENNPSQESEYGTAKYLYRQF